MISVVTLAIASSAAEPIIVVADGGGVARRGAVPVSVRVDLASLLGKPVKPGQLRLAELTGPEPSRAEPVPVQFEAEATGLLKGVLWWLLPSAAEKERRFRLSVAAEDAPAALTVQLDSSKSFYDIREGSLPVLRYNHGTVPVPAGIDTNYARGDYIMPLFGPSGEMLTDDYPKDHPHHRGVSWSWPVTRWGNEVRDIWAVRGVWVRPVAMQRVEAGPLFALLQAENVWKWGDTNPIVREEVVIRAFRRSGNDRLIDVEVRLSALVDGAAIGGRPHAGYGGFGLRAMPALQRVITRHTDPAEAQPRRSWLDYSGVFAGGKGPAGLAIFEHVTNLYYPNALLSARNLIASCLRFPGAQVPLARSNRSCSSIASASMPGWRSNRNWPTSGRRTPVLQQQRSRRIENH